MRITTFIHEALMNQATLLLHALRPLAWHGARLSFLAAFLIALLRVRTVNFAELATGFSGKAQTDSHYKRLQRFFRSYELNYVEIAQAVVALMAIPEPWVLSLDRTEWQFGDCVFNILMLGVVHEGVAFPLVWCLLDKRGNSNSDERMQLFNQFLERFGERDIACLTADREFVGKDWFGYLLNEPLTSFRIRIRENHNLDDGRVSLNVRIAFADLAVGQTKILRHKRRGEWLHHVKPLTIKKHGRRAKSIFRYGFDHLRNIVLNLEQKMDDFREVLQFLSCT